MKYFSLGQQLIVYSFIPTFRLTMCIPRGLFNAYQHINSTILSMIQHIPSTFVSFSVTPMYVYAVCICYIQDMYSWATQDFSEMESTLAVQQVRRIQCIHVIYVCVHLLVLCCSLEVLHLSTRVIVKEALIL